MYCMYPNVLVCIMYVSCMYYSEYAFFEMDTRGYGHDMETIEFVCIQYTQICIACIMYLLYIRSVYTKNICMYYWYPHYIWTYMHVSNCFQSLW
jgi:hypothetical protein